MSIAASALSSRKLSVDLSGHHALCELNYHRISKILQGLKSGQEKWFFSIPLSAKNIVRPNIEVELSVLESAPYTTTIAILQNHPDLASLVFMNQPRMVVRLYHDAAMAEIISWDKHRHWLPKYDYPNRNMYHPDEKLALNKFFGDWLVFCLKHGYLRSDICERVLVTRN